MKEVRGLRSRAASAGRTERPGRLVLRDRARCTRTWNRDRGAPVDARWPSGFDILDRLCPWAASNRSWLVIINREENLLWICSIHEVGGGAGPGRRGGPVRPACGGRARRDD